VETQRMATSCITQLVAVSDAEIQTESDHVM